MQTLSKLHQNAHLAHLDLNSANVMLTPQTSEQWDKLRLLDFGFALKSKSGTRCNMPGH